MTPERRARLLDRLASPDGPSAPVSARRGVAWCTPTLGTRRAGIVAQILTVRRLYSCLRLGDRTAGQAVPSVTSEAPAVGLPAAREPLRRRRCELPVDGRRLDEP